MAEALPTYREVDEEPSPAYSERSFIVEEITRPRGSSVSTNDVWTYSTRHMEINLGDREAWSKSMPAYGLNGTVQGHVKLKGVPAHVHQVTAMLKGTITITLLDRGMAVEWSETQLLSRNLLIYERGANDHSPWAEKYDFAIPLPNEVNVTNAITALPPTFLVYHSEISAEVAYSLRFDMVRKGLRRHERLVIPIMYLPKSYPKYPLITHIPLPPVDLLRNPIPADDRTLIRKMNPLWSKSQVSDDSHVSAFLFLPSSLCVSSGESLPFLLCVFAAHSPALAKLLVSNMQVKLLKRSSFVSKIGEDAFIEDEQLALAELREVPQSSEGVAIFQGKVRAGKGGREYSWGVKDAAEVQYIFSALLSPPDGIVEHLPSFKHEEVIEVTTDRFESLERDRLGRPMPALGLLKTLESRPKEPPKFMDVSSYIMTTGW